MRNIFSRPMFRNPNVRNDMLRGIMASGPELMRASYQPPKPKTIGETAREIKNFIVTPAGASTIGQAKAAENYQQSFGEKEVSDATELFKQDKIKADKAEKERLDKLNKMEEEDPDSATEPTAKSLFEPFIKKPKAETENVETPNKGITSDMSKELGLTNEMIARNRTALTDMASLEDKEFFGTTANKVTQELFDEYNKEGKEVTLADVRDKGIKILGFDPDKLEENFDEDRRSALFLRIMQAGLAMAAGESDNALTNVAKGLSVGLAGYGDDVKFLSKEMKADRREAANTMYRLLGDAKSEQLAKETLSLNKKIAQQQIVSSKVGEEKNKLLKELELKNANASLKLNFYATMRDQNFKEKKFQIERDQFDKSLNATLQKIPSKELQQLYEMGEVTLIDESKGLIPGNFEMSEKGKKLMEGILKDDFGGKITDKKQKRSSIGKFGNVEGITDPNFEYENGTLKNQTDIVDMGVLQEQLNEGPYKKQIQDGEYRAAGETLIALAKQRGLKIDLAKLNPAIKKALGERKSGDRIIDESLLNDPVFFDSTD